MDLNDLAVCFDNADSFEQDHFDQFSHLIFWLIYDANHGLLVITRLTGTFKNVLKYSSCRSHVVDLTKDINDQIVESDLQVKDES